MSTYLTCLCLFLTGDPTGLPSTDAPATDTSASASFAAPPSVLLPRLLVNHGPGTSGGGSAVISGETLRQGRYAFSLRSELTCFDAASAAEAEQLAIDLGEFDSLEKAWVGTFGFDYGVTDDLQVGLEIGYYMGSDFLDAEADGKGGAELATADPEGLTDLWIRSKWRVVRGASGHLSLIGGVKLPTGVDDEQLSSGETLEPSSQPGTGSVDYQLGLAFSRFLTPRVSMDASLLHTLRTEHDDFEVGDRTDAGIALSYRLTEDVQAPNNWSVFGELHGVWLGKDEEEGEPNENSGGSTVYLSAGLRDRVSDSFAVSLAPAVAVLHDLNGEQVETDWRVALTLTISP